MALEPRRRPRSCEVGVTSATGLNSGVYYSHEAQLSVF